MTANDLKELLSIASCLACSDARDVLKFIHGDGVEGSHRLKGGVLEDDVGRDIILLPHLLPKILHYSEENGVR